MGLKTFTASGGRVLRVVKGFRHRVLEYRPRLTPQPDWTEADFIHGADIKRRRCGRLIEKFSAHGGALGATSALDVGCGDGSNCLVLAQRGANWASTARRFCSPARRAGTRASSRWPKP